MLKISIVNGPNLNLLGSRETQIYGEMSFDSYFKELKNTKNADLSYFQSNIEGELIDFLHNCQSDIIILNAGAYTHTSIALHDCIKAISKPVIEVHISNIINRESFRHVSMISPVAIGCIFGFGLDSYSLATDYAINYFKK